MHYLKVRINTIGWSGRCTFSCIWNGHYSSPDVHGLYIFPTTSLLQSAVMSSTMLAGHLIPLQSVAIIIKPRAERRDVAVTGLKGHRSRHWVQVGLAPDLSTHRSTQLNRRGRWCHWPWLRALRRRVADDDETQWMHIGRGCCVVVTCVEWRAHLLAWRHRNEDGFMSMQPNKMAAYTLIVRYAKLLRNFSNMFT